VGKAGTDLEATRSVPYIKTFWQDTGLGRQSYLVKAVFKFRNYIVIKLSTGVVSSKSPGSE